MSQDMMVEDGLATLRQKVTQLLQQHTAYDMLPVSFRLVVFDATLQIPSGLALLLQNVWDSENNAYVGMLTVTDILVLVRHYYDQYAYAEAMSEISNLGLDAFKDLYRKITERSCNTLALHPLKSLYDAARMLIGTDYHSLALVDTDTHSAQDSVVSVLSLYSILRFVSMNFKEKRLLREPLADRQIGTYEEIATATMDTRVIEVIHVFVDKNISVVPIVDEQGKVVNVFEDKDVMIMARDDALGNLDIPVCEAIQRRPDDFAGVLTCRITDTLLSVMDLLRTSQLHRLIVVDEEEHLVGIVSLSDILRAIML
ncbi:AMP-activated serine/threonine-protein kinase regulatory subunit [Tieghemiomyces parasiticus]|uniref:AMP-activated serine/threonine-protein kinase regulatory subunit n=1 Tax=Tieghemiomyces parasiticus TaxID=78921 RepID=A0A9W8E267_9FUNG|nr:AMP-activated serine/threonine-protein kinase regulatory subunit [Tieghemiomyces parasiticus]